MKIKMMVMLSLLLPTACTAGKNKKKVKLLNQAPSDYNIGQLLRSATENGDSKKLNECKEFLEKHKDLCLAGHIKILVLNPIELQKKRDNNYLKTERGYLSFKDGERGCFVRTINFQEKQFLKNYLEKTRNDRASAKWYHVWLGRPAIATLLLWCLTNIIIKKTTDTCPATDSLLLKSLYWA